MLGKIKDSTLLSLSASVGLLVFGSINYGIHTTFGPSSFKLGDTLKEYATMQELIISHSNNGHNHNEAEHIH